MLLTPAPGPGVPQSPGELPVTVPVWRKLSIGAIHPIRAYSPDV